MIFKSKKCKKCGASLKGEWNYCPICGSYLKTRVPELFRPYQSFFEQIEKEFEEFDKLTKEFFKFPEFEPKSRGGISITITSRTGTEPKISVKTYGKYKGMEDKIMERLGVRKKVPIKEIKTERKMPKVTKEGKVEVKDLAGKKIVEIELPGVKSIEDIEIRELEQSIEVKAFAGDKAYFNLIPLNPGFRIEKKEFRGGKLILEISY